MTSSSGDHPQSSTAHTSTHTEPAATAFPVYGEYYAPTTSKNTSKSTDKHEAHMPSTQPTSIPSTSYSHSSTGHYPYPQTYETASYNNYGVGGTQQYANAGQYNGYQQDNYAVKGFFNSKTGRFQKIEDDAAASQYLDPYSYFSDYSKSVRQCSNFFDYNAWVEDQGGITKAKRHQKLSKKDIEKLKKARKQKKEIAKRKWLIEN
jgi:hypothetical protein